MKPLKTFTRRRPHATHLLALLMMCLPAGAQPSAEMQRQSAGAQQPVWLQLRSGETLTMKVFEGDTLTYEPEDSVLFVGRNVALPVKMIARLTTEGPDNARRVGWYNHEDNGSSVFVPQQNHLASGLTSYYRFEAEGGICTKMEFRVESDDEALLEEYWNSGEESTGINGPYSYTRRTLSRQRRLRLTDNCAAWLGRAGIPDYALWRNEHAVCYDYTPLVEGLPMDDVRLLMMWWNSEVRLLPPSLMPHALLYGTYDPATSTYRAKANWMALECTIALNWDDSHTHVVGSTMTWDFQREYADDVVYSYVSQQADENLDIQHSGHRIVFTERYTTADGVPAPVSFEQAWHDLLLFDMDWMKPEERR